LLLYSANFSNFFTKKDDRNPRDGFWSNNLNHQNPPSNPLCSLPIHGTRPLDPHGRHSQDPGPSRRHGHDHHHPAQRRTIRAHSASRHRWIRPSYRPRGDTFSVDCRTGAAAWEEKQAMENTAILREWFDRVDSERIGSVTATQLKTALAVGNLEFPLSVVQQMIRMYDFDRNGTMSFDEFVALNKFLIKVQQAFSDLERDRGYLVPDDVYEGLVKVGFSLDSPAFYTVCEVTSSRILSQSFDQKKNGKFRLDDFISLCIFVQSARNLFESFDTAKQGRISLDMNQFIYCTANCRI
ncbi:unnamed protein product, partial [Linum perenne]